MDWGVELDRNFRAEHDSRSPTVGTKRTASYSRDQVSKRPKTDTNDTTSDVKVLSDPQMQVLVKTNSLKKVRSFQF